MSPPFREYVEAGLSAIPIQPDGSKAAAIPWKPYTERLPTLEEAADWEHRFQGAAIVCGAVSGNLELIDLDEPTLVRPFLEAVTKQDPGLYDRLTLIKTPRRNQSGQGGCHVVYRCAVEIPGNQKLAMSENEPVVDADGKPIIDPNTNEQRTAPRTLVETRGRAGYFLTVGCSAECHPTGNLYEQVHGPSLTELSVLTAAERETLHQVARMFDRSVAETHSEPPVHGYERHRDGESPGDQFNARATWSEILEPHGWQCVGESGGIKQWRRPGKATGISATTGILSKAGNELFTNFSQNGHPFESSKDNGKPGVSYSKFAAHALLNHGGDYQAAAKALQELGYGTAPRKTERKERVLKTTVADAERNYLEMLEQGRGELVSLGIPMLDRAIGGGVERGESVVIGGLTSHGKSVCGLQAARAVAESGGHVILVSHEMGSTAVAKRMIASRTPLDGDQWFEHVDTLRHDSERYWKGCGSVFLLEQCRTIQGIEKAVEQIASEYELGMIIIDHAQLTKGEGGTRYEALTDASGRFKGLAIKHNAIALVLSQLNRQAVNEEQGAHHLRESGALEQDADVVLLVRWPWKEKAEGNDPKRYLITVCKNRNRPIIQWQVEARFNPARQLIEAPIAEKPQFLEGYEPKDEQERLW